MNDFKSQLTGVVEGVGSSTSSVLGGTSFVATPSYQSIPPLASTPSATASKKRRRYLVVWISVLALFLWLAWIRRGKILQKLEDVEGTRAAMRAPLQTSSLPGASHREQESSASPMQYAQRAFEDELVLHDPLFQPFR